MHRLGENKENKKLYIFKLFHTNHWM